MDRDLDKRLSAIEKKLDALIRQTDPKHVRREVEAMQGSGRRKGYAGVSDEMMAAMRQKGL